MIQVGHSWAPRLYYPWHPSFPLRFRQDVLFQLEPVRKPTLEPESFNQTKQSGVIGDADRDGFLGFSDENFTSNAPWMNWCVAWMNLAMTASSDQKLHHWHTFSRSRVSTSWETNIPKGTYDDIYSHSEEEERASSYQLATDVRFGELKRESGGEVKEIDLDII